MALPVIKDHVEEGEDLLLSQWEDSPNIRGLLKSYIENLQLVEDALFQLLNERGLYTAIGEQLDVLGRILGEPRKAKTDEAYRVALVGRATANNSDGSTEDVMRTLKAVTQAVNITFFEHYPASVHYYADSGVSNGIIEALDRASSAGINTRVLYDLEQTMFLASEYTTISDTILVNELLANIQAIDADLNLYDIGIGTFGSTETGPRSIFPEGKGLHTQALSNPDFIDGLTNWTTVSGTPVVTSGTLELQSGDSVTQSITTVASTIYTVMLDSVSTTGTFTISVGTTSGGSEIASFTTEFDDLGNISQLVDFTATGTTTYITAADSGGTSNVDGIYVGEYWINSSLLNPLCDVLDATDFSLELGNMIDNTGDNVINDLSENIKYLI